MTGSDAALDDRIDGDSSVELSSNRTSLSFERTRMSADRTLMSTMRTSLSLISFGFTIYETFSQLAEKGVLGASQTARQLGIGLLAVGVVMLGLGVATAARFNRDLTQRRERLFGIGLMHNAVRYHATPTFVAAALLFALGVLALISIALRISL